MNEDVVMRVLELLNKINKGKRKGEMNGKQ